jgi:hypothetical protein
LEEDFAVRGEGVGAFIGELSVDVLAYVSSLRNEFEAVPLAVGLFELAGGIADASDVGKGALVEVRDEESGAWRAGDTLAVASSEGSAVRHPEVAGAALVDLELDGAGPDLLFALDVEEDAAVASLTLALQEGAFAPLEIGAEVEVLVGVAGDDVSEAVTGDVDDAFLDLEDVVGVGVEALAADEGFKVAEVVAVEQNDRRLVRRDLLCTSRNGGREQQERGDCEDAGRNGFLRSAVEEARRY